MYGELKRKHGGRQRRIESDKPVGRPASIKAEHQEDKGLFFVRFAYCSVCMLLHFSSKLIKDWPGFPLTTIVKTLAEVSRPTFRNL